MQFNGEGTVSGGGIPSSSLLFEYKASSLLGADGSAISQWDDSSANARHATESNASFKPTCKTGILNGFSVARFDGGDQLSYAYTPQMNTLTFFTVMKCTDNGVRTLIASDINNCAQLRINNNKIEFLKSTVALMITGSTTLSTSTFYTVAVTYDKAGGTNNLNIYLNGASDGVATRTDDLSVFNSRLGRNSNNGEFFLGDMAHAIGYSAVLNSTDLTTVFNYLRGLYAHY